MAHLTALICNFLELLLTVILNARLFSPLVVEPGGHKPQRSSQRNAAESPGQGEPSARICHVYLTNIQPIDTRFRHRIRPSAPPSTAQYRTSVDHETSVSSGGRDGEGQAGTRGEPPSNTCRKDGTN